VSTERVETLAIIRRPVAANDPASAGCSWSGGSVLSGLRTFMERRDAVKEEHAETCVLPEDSRVARTNQEAWARFIADAGLDPDEVAEISREMGEGAAYDALVAAQQSGLTLEGLTQIFQGVWCDGLVTGRTFKPEGAAG